MAGVPGVVAEQVAPAAASRARAGSGVGGSPGRVVDGAADCRHEPVIDRRPPGLTASCQGDGAVALDRKGPARPPPAVVTARRSSRPLDGPGAVGCGDVGTPARGRPPAPHSRPGRSTTCPPRPPRGRRPPSSRVRRSRPRGGGRSPAWRPGG